MMQTRCYLEVCHKTKSSMDLLPPVVQSDKFIQTLHATTALPRLNKKATLSRREFYHQQANVDDPTRSKYDVRRRTSFVTELKWSLVELDEFTEGDFNHSWIQEFRDLYFNPLSLKRIYYVMCLISADMVVTDYFDKIADLGYYERLGIAEHEGERLWQLMSTIGYATPLTTGGKSLILLVNHCLRRFSTQNNRCIVLFSLFSPCIGFCITSSSIVRHWGVLTYRWNLYW